MAGKVLLLSVENVKLRTSGASKSPVGRISIFEDRLEWDDSSSEDKLIVMFNDIRDYIVFLILGQRISPPNKSKTQLQVCLQNDEQATFVFVNPLGKEEHLKDRDLVKETLQQALIQHRQLASEAAAATIRNNRAREYEAKKKILEDNIHLLELYRHLVSTKLVSPDDFWTEYYQTKDSHEGGKLGVSSGFLSNIAKSEGTNGVKLNLNVETIQSIFRTYPAVERKHLELVPHELTEQEFWAKFFQSHYFHRERDAASTTNDPFAECVKVDEAEMNDMLNQKIRKNALDFDYMRDQTIANDLSNAPSCSSSRAMLIKRFNYHSERVLLTIVNNRLSPENKTEASKINESEMNTDDNEDQEYSVLESDELRSDTCQQSLQEVKIAINEELKKLANRFSPKQAQEYSNIISDLCTAEDDMDYLNDSFEDLDEESHEELSRLASATKEISDQKLDGDATDAFELQTVHDVAVELLKHFWACYPPTTPKKYVKILRMKDTLKNFAENQLAEAVQRFGEDKVLYCRKMIEIAFDRYEMYTNMEKKNEESGMRSEGQHEEEV